MLKTASILLVLIAGSLPGARTLHAQASSGPSSVTFGLSGGWAVPSGDLADVTDMGYTLGASVQSKRERSSFSFRADVGYTSLAGGRFALAGADYDAPNARILSGTVNLILSSPAGWRFGPYVVGGVGIYNIDYGAVDDPVVADEFDNSTDVGLNVGAGLRFPLGPVNAFTEIRWHNVSSGEPNRYFAPIVVGVTF